MQIARARARENFVARARPRLSRSITACISLVALIDLFLPLYLYNASIEIYVPDRIDCAYDVCCLC